MHTTQRFPKWLSCFCFLQFDAVNRTKNQTKKKINEFGKKREKNIARACVKRVNCKISSWRNEIHDVNFHKHTLAPHAFCREEEPKRKKCVFAVRYRRHYSHHRNGRTSRRAFIWHTRTHIQCFVAGSNIELLSRIAVVDRRNVKRNSYSPHRMFWASWKR